MKAKLTALIEKVPSAIIHPTAYDLGLKQLFSITRLPRFTCNLLRKDDDHLTLKELLGRRLIKQDQKRCVADPPGKVLGKRRKMEEYEEYLGPKMQTFQSDYQRKMAGQEMNEDCNNGKKGEKIDPTIAILQKTSTIPHVRDPQRVARYVKCKQDLTKPSHLKTKVLQVRTVKNLQTLEMMRKF